MSATDSEGMAHDAATGSPRLMIHAALQQYARWLRENHLEAIAEHMQHALDARGLWPLPGLENFTKEQWIASGMEQMREQLTDIEAGDLPALIDKSIARYDRYFTDPETGDVNYPEQFAKISYARKEALLFFLGGYAKSLPELLQIVREMDQFTEAFDLEVNRNYLFQSYLKTETKLRKELDAREAALLQAQAISHTGSFDFDLVNNKTACSPELSRIMDLEDINDWPVYESKIHPDDLDIMHDALQRAYNETGYYECQYRYNNMDGERVLWCKGKVSFENEKPVRLIGTVTDITERQQLLSQLHVSESRYRRAEATANIGIYSFDLFTGVRYWSDEMYRITEMPFEDGAPSTAAADALLHPDDRVLIEQRRAELLNQHLPVDQVYRLLMPDGRIKFMHARASIVFDNQGRPVRAEGTLQDVTAEQALLQKLRNIQQQYEEAEAIAHIGHFEFDLPSNTHFWTDELYRIYGWEPGTAPLDRALTLRACHPDDLDRALEASARSLERCEPYSINYRIIRPDGSIRFVLAHARVRVNGHGVATGMFGTIQDVTEKEELIAHLQKSRALYKQAQAIAHIGNFTFDIADNRVTWSDETYRIYGADPADVQVTASQLREYTLPKYRKLNDAHIKRCVDTGAEYQFQYEIQLPDGRIKTLRAKGEAEKDASGKPVRIIGTVQDISDQIYIEQRLRDNQRFNEKISNASPAIIAVHRLKDNSFTFMNQRLESLLGYSVETMMAGGLEYLATITHPDDLAGVTSRLEKAIRIANEPGYEDDTIFQLRYRLRHADGTWRWYQSFIIVFDRDAEGKVSHMLSVVIDVNDTVEAEEQLRVKNEALQQSNASLEEFAYIASHDLQEPLRKISTFGNMLQSMQQSGMSDQGRLFITKIVDSAGRMQGMIKDLLSISLISGNKEFKEEHLQGLLDDVLQTLEYKIESTSTTIEIAPQPLPVARVIDTQFKQLFQNLISNSIKFARPDVLPRIDIHWRALPPEDAVSYGLSSDGQYLQFILTDNGIGFDNQYAGRIFAMFQRLNGRSEYEGSGIGLAICRKIVEHHSGAIRASGILGEGARFEIVMPA